MKTSKRITGLAWALAGLLAIGGAPPAGGQPASVPAPTNNAKTPATAPAPAEAAVTPPQPATQTTPPSDATPASGSASGPGAGAADPSKSATQAPKPADATAEADAQKRELATAMTRITARWRQRAAAEGWAVHPATPVEAVAGFNASERQTSASGQPGGQLGAAAHALPRPSEKSGSAPPSENVKQPRAASGARP